MLKPICGFLAIPSFSAAAGKVRPDRTRTKELVLENFMFTAVTTMQPVPLLLAISYKNKIGGIRRTVLSDETIQKEEHSVIYYGKSLYFLYQIP